MKTITCYIGLGSNQQNPHNQLNEAIKALSQLPHSQIVSHSSFYQSSPLVDTDIAKNSLENQPDDYINAVVKLATSLLPFELLKNLQSIELQQGRVRDPNNRWASRTLDLDILLYADKAIQTQTLIIPHYHMQHRDFVLVPLLEITQEYIFQDGFQASKLLQQCENNNLTKIAGTSKNL